MKHFIKKILTKMGLGDYITRLRKRRTFRRLDQEEHLFVAENLEILESMEYKMRLRIHSMEKNFVLGNKAIIENEALFISFINDLMDLIGFGFAPETNIIQEGLAIVNYWLKNNSSFKEKDTKANRAVSEFLIKNGLIESELPSTIDVELNNGKKKEIDYYSFVNSRVSVREMEPEIISRKTILEIIDLANLCVSACNRQPCKVYFSVDSDMLRKIGDLCIDRMVAKNIFNFLVVTVDKSLFLSTEAYQAWINGGIFLDSLVNSIHAKSLASCVLQMPKNREQTRKFKKLLEIPDNEDIVCIVGFGKYKENGKSIRKHRKPVDNIAVER